MVEYTMKTENIEVLIHPHSAGPRSLQHQTSIITNLASRDQSVSSRALDEANHALATLAPKSEISGCVTKWNRTVINDRKMSEQERWIAQVEYDAKRRKEAKDRRMEEEKRKGRKEITREEEKEC
ncbi:uncharacterized protein [Palaemon carinicauda]|uniref:uncharacterized protein n=1 Tax=Palaemon carinicauda TaxID=392227 RepID=UPI0035B5B4B9